MLVIAIAQPSGAVLSALNLIPFGLALVAVRGDSRKSARWAGLLTNVLWALLYLVGAVALLAWGSGGSLQAVPFLLLIATPCVFNAATLWPGEGANA